MKIQFISFTSNSSIADDVIDNTIFGEFKAFDDYDVNVIDLRDELIWTNNGTKIDTVNCIAHFESFREAISICHSSKLLILLPENKYYRYNNVYNSSLRRKTYNSTKLLKDMIPSFLRIINVIVPRSFNLVFSNTQTQIGPHLIKSNFIITETDDYNVLTKSKTSNMVTTVGKDNLAYTTLQIANSDELLSILNYIAFLPNDDQDRPEWFSQVEMFDDIELKTEIKKYEKEIDIIKNKIEKKNQQLHENDRLKSIVYTSGKELVDVVFAILEEVLGCDLSQFEDEHKEDYEVNIDGTVFFFFFKGISSNVKSENVSQLERHYGRFLDDNPNVEKECIHKALIVNHQRQKKIEDRKPINDLQIQLAKKYNSLIIETTTLLAMLEKYRSGEMDNARCRELFQQTGLLKL